MNVPFVTLTVTCDYPNFRHTKGRWVICPFSLYRIMGNSLLLIISKGTCFVATQTNVTSRIDKSISLPSGWSETEYSECRNGAAYSSLSIATCKTDFGINDDSKCVRVLYFPEVVIKDKKTHKRHQKLRLHNDCGPT